MLLGVGGATIGMGGTYGPQAQAQAQAQAQPAKPSISGALADLEPVLGRLLNVQVELSRIAERLVGSQAAKVNEMPRDVASSVIGRVYEVRETLVRLAEGLEASLRLIEDGL